MVVSEKSATGGEVDEEPIYFSIELRYINNFLSNNSNQLGKLILESIRNAKVGEFMIIFNGVHFEIVKVKSNYQLENLSITGIEIVGKVKSIEYFL